MRCPESEAGKVFLALKTNTATDGQLDIMSSIHTWSVGAYIRYVEVVVGIVFVDRCQKFLLGKRIILIRHTSSTGYIYLSLRNELVAGELHIIVIRPYRDDFKLTGLAVEIHFEEVCAVFFLPSPASSLPSWNETRITRPPSYNRWVEGQTVSVK